MREKNIISIIALVCVILTLIIIISTYAIFESNVNGQIVVEKAKWIIYVNNTNISSGINRNFVIDNVEIESNDRIEEGNIAPGLRGKFNIVIDPKDTDVSVRYDIKFDFSKIEKTKIKIDSIDEIENNGIFVKTAEDTYTGIITLDQIKSGTINDIQVDFYWENDETKNEQDTEIGKIVNNKIEIPVEISVKQYLGEEIKEIN